ncbi:Cof-type HAD-IIB family hydrolase [Mesoplasma lactucae]|uniref:HAD family hydrolase n=1 Tax=Mesoplasma lactucae ATCC 49193 TaxID=81460 RepID=A0A291ISA9_9MOLU|nr:Cof-type HAD-IIB family hydrolase [Mesoplasma lactucae]ATG97596.1 HAD family hydrolase [Mesoplasma lactucae ATCC 49193]ATZ19944.1 haloacid dehalogenase [Mesoplasma lactucae ATCC 49193]MCL8217105.1 Sugar phosphatase YidA [Mesoplasma lactucae ATCC 49193]
MKIKLLALDMDGTTYYKGGEIVPANVKPIQQALEKGVDVVIVTGRPALAKQNKLVENGLNYKNALIAACNGACIYDFNDKKILKSSPISSTDAKTLFDLAKNKYPDVEVWGYVDDLNTVVQSRDTNHTEGWVFESGFFDGEYILFDDVEDNFNYSFFKLLAFNVSEEYIKEVQKLGLEHALSAKEHVLEINAKGINKAFAVKYLAEEFKVPHEQTMAIGDGMNDLPMIEYVKWGVSLENSVDAVKKVAQIHINKTNVEGGVAEAIDKYILNEK